MRGLFHFPFVPPGLSVLRMNVGPLSPPAATLSPVLSAPLPSPPLLLVWVSVSSLTPWLLDFHTVRFSVSSDCFLLLNCCPSFGCARRHSVSTYASILAGSPCFYFHSAQNISQIVVLMRLESHEGASLPPFFPLRAGWQGLALLCTLPSASQPSAATLSAQAGPGESSSSDSQN